MAITKCPECGKEVSDKAQSCPNCGYPISQNTTDQQEIKPANSPYMITVKGQNINMDAIWHRKKSKAGMAGELRKIAKIDTKYSISLAEQYMNEKGVKDNNNNATGCLILIIGFIAIAFLIADSGDKESKEATTQEVVTEQVVEETQPSTEIDIESMKESAAEVTYDDIYRNPETWRNQYVKVTAHVEEYDTAILGLMDTYECTIGGELVYIMDYRDKKEPTISKGDTVIIYGKGSGMATQKVKTKNQYGVTTNSEKTKIPQINMYAVELQ